MTRIAINGHDLSEEVEGDGSLESMRPQQTGLAATHRVHAYEGTPWTTSVPPYRRTGLLACSEWGSDPTRCRGGGGRDSR